MITVLTNMNEISQLQALITHLNVVIVSQQEDPLAELQPFKKFDRNGYMIIIDLLNQLIEYVRYVSM